ncbi:MAG: hypothetical protein RLZZ393_1289 [Pseudomonadota bacterium]|jgi:DNA-binding transcriptional ArsR family regulator
MESKDVIGALGALAQESRLAAFRALVAAGTNGLQPGTLVARLGIPANTLSFHLGTLQRAGLVSQERQGRALIYRAEFQRMRTLIDFLTEDCCGGQPCAATPCTPETP